METKATTDGSTPLGKSKKQKKTRRNKVTKHVADYWVRLVHSFCNIDPTLDNVIISQGDDHECVIIKLLDIPEDRRMDQPEHMQQKKFPTQISSTMDQALIGDEVGASTHLQSARRVGPQHKENPRLILDSGTEQTVVGSSGWV